jgi:hypothetical protein
MKNGEKTLKEEILEDVRKECKIQRHYMILEIFSWLLMTSWIVSFGVIFYFVVTNWKTNLILGILLLLSTISFLIYENHLTKYVMLTGKNPNDEVKDNGDDE